MMDEGHESHPDDVRIHGTVLHCAGARPDGQSWRTDGVSVHVPAAPAPPNVVCLCGSTRFASTFNEVAIAETLADRIVVRPEVVTYDGTTDPQRVNQAQKAALDDLHLRKIDPADEKASSLARADQGRLARGALGMRCIECHKPGATDPVLGGYRHEACKPPRRDPPLVALPPPEFDLTRASSGGIVRFPPTLRPGGRPTAP